MLLQFSRFSYYPMRAQSFLSCTALKVGTLIGISVTVRMDRATQRNLPYYERNLLLETRKVLIGWTLQY